MNKVILVGRLSRDPEMRALASGKSVATFAVTTNEYAGDGHETAEHHAVVVWDRLAEICAQYLGKGQQVAVEGRLQSRSWDDDLGRRHSKTEVVASAVEMLSGRGKGATQEAVAISAGCRGPWRPVKRPTTECDGALRHGNG